MFEAIDFEKSIKHLKIKWLDDNLFSKYAVPILLLIGLPVPIAMILVNNAGINYNLLYPAILVFLSIIGLLLLSLYWIHANDKLFEVTSFVYSREVRKSIETAIGNSGWKICRANNSYITAHKPGKWLPGSKMAILFHKGTLLLNVQNHNGFRGYFPFSFGSNKRMADEIIQIIK